jgi:hypothetical protein
MPALWRANNLEQQQSFDKLVPTAATVLLNKENLGCWLSWMLCYKFPTTHGLPACRCAAVPHTGTGHTYAHPAAPAAPQHAAKCADAHGTVRWRNPILPMYCGVPLHACLSSSTAASAHALLRADPTDHQTNSLRGSRHDLAHTMQHPCGAVARRMCLTCSLDRCRYEPQPLLNLQPPTGTAAVPVNSHAVYLHTSSCNDGCLGASAPGPNTAATSSHKPAQRLR